jgi:hypothetical protein
MRGAAIGGCARLTECYEDKMLLRALILLPVILAGTAAPAQPRTDDIIGYNFACTAKVAMPLPSSDLEGHVIVNEDGTLFSFFAQLYGIRAEADPVGWAGAKQLRALGASEHVRWNMVWREEGGSIPLSFGAGQLRIEVSTPRKLALENMLAVGRDAFPSAPMVASSTRWPGKKNGAEFAFEIAELFGFAGNAPSLRWWLYSAPLPYAMSVDSTRRRASGSLDLAAPRSAAGPFEKLKAELLAKTVDFEKSCTRRPIHYDGSAEI